MKVGAVELRNPYLAATLAWLIPGLGHLYQRRVAKAVLYFVCVMGLFVAGLVMSDGRAVYFRWDKAEWRYQYLAQIGAGLVATPPLARLSRPPVAAPSIIGRLFVAPSEEELDEAHRDLGSQMDMAIVYTMIAGLLNFLVVYDALAGPAHADDEETVSTVGKGSQA